SGWWFGDDTWRYVDLPTSS
ncbi:nitrite/Sulfite reductase ferredoxin-like half domain protein, partial [Vibrio parahaemolyticus V-223/04]